MNNSTIRRQAKISICFLPRERFQLATDSLRRILATTDQTAELIAIDCGTPEKYIRELRALCKGHANARFVRTDKHLLPNQSRNLAIKAAKGDYICLIKNDTLVEGDWINQLVHTFEEYGADVVAPMIVEVKSGKQMVHQRPKRIES